MSARFLTALFLSTFVLLSIVQVPMSAAISWMNVDRYGVSYGQVKGSIWSGSLTDVAWRGVRVGDVQITLKPLALLLGRAAARVEIENAGAVEGSLNIARGVTSTISIEDTEISVLVDDMPMILPIRGAAKFTVREAIFDAQGCKNLVADLQTDAMRQSTVGFDWRAPVLSGSAQCVDGKVVLPLEGGEGAERVSVVVEIQRNGLFTIDAEVNTEDDSLAAMLGVVGFSMSDGAYTLSQEGRWG